MTEEQLMAEINARVADVQEKFWANQEARRTGSDYDEESTEMALDRAKYALAEARDEYYREL
jgi:hypothetical protein